jgi:hypothetical protein
MISEALKKQLDKLTEEVLNSDKPLSANGIGTGAMIAGFVGKVTGFEWAPVTGARTVKRNNDQTLMIDGKPIVVAKKGEDAIAFYMVFGEGTKRITTTLLEQNVNSTIDLGDGNVRKFSSFAGKDWKALTNKVLRCDFAARDTNAAPIQRLNGVVTDGVAELAPQQPMLFKFTVLADEAAAAA